MSKHVKHKHVKSQKQHLNILWGRGAEDRGLTYEVVGREKQIPFFRHGFIILLFFYLN